MKQLIEQGGPQYVENLQRIANGIEEVENEYQPAGLIYVDETPVGGGRPVKVLAFPGLPPEQLVLVKQKVRMRGPDRAANVYLIDRILGRPETVVRQTPPIKEPPAVLTAEDLVAIWKLEG